MRICVPTETDEGKTARVCGHFGSARYLTIVDTEKDSVEVIHNGDHHHAHGMCQPIKALMGEKIDVVVTGGMGSRAVQRLNEGGIKAYRAIPGTVDEMVGRFKKGGLEEIIAENACAQHECH